MFLAADSIEIRNDLKRVLTNSNSANELFGTQIEGLVSEVKLFLNLDNWTQLSGLRNNAVRAQVAKLKSELQYKTVLRL